jgi:hypothetical protein
MFYVQCIATEYAATRTRGIVRLQNIINESEITSNHIWVSPPVKKIAREKRNVSHETIKEKKHR